MKTMSKAFGVLGMLVGVASWGWGAGAGTSAGDFLMFWAGGGTMGVSQRFMKPFLIFKPLFRSVTFFWWVIMGFLVFGWGFISELHAGWYWQNIDSESTLESKVLFDRDQNPNIVYLTKDGQKVKHARWNGISWALTVIDNTNSNYFKRISLTQDAQGKIFVGYMSEREIKIGRWDGVTWSTQTVTRLVANDSPSEFSIALDTSNLPGISYSDTSIYSFSHTLNYAHWTGIKWSTETVDSSFGLSGNSALGYDSIGNPVIVYGGGIQNFLYLAKKTLGSWEISKIDSGNNMGSVSEIFLRTYNNGFMNTYYFDFIKKRIKQAEWNGVKWSTQTLFPSDMVNVGFSQTYNEAGQAGFIFNKNCALWNGTNWDINEVPLANGTLDSLGFDSLGQPFISYSSYSEGLGSINRGPLPTGPSDVNASTRTASSITWNWKDNSKEEMGYKVLRSSDNFNLSGDLPADTTSWILSSGLTPNSTYQVKIVAFNDSGDSNMALSPITYTRANAPSDLKVNTVTPINPIGTSISLSWSANGNPPMSSYTIESSTDGVNFSFLNNGPLRLVSHDFFLPETTYYFRVKTFNTDGVQPYFSDYSNIVSTKSIAAKTTLLGVGSRNTVDNLVSAPESISLLTDSSGTAHLAYFDRASSAVKYASRIGNKWSVQTVATSTGNDASVQLTLDSSGFPHMTFRTKDNTDTVLNYARRTGDNWEIFEATRSHFLGGGTAIAVDGDGVPHITYTDLFFYKVEYYEVYNQVLRYATRKGNVWETSTLDTLVIRGSQSILNTSLSINAHNKPIGTYYSMADGCLNIITMGEAHWNFTSLSCDGEEFRSKSIYDSKNGALHVTYSNNGISYGRYYDFVNYKSKEKLDPSANDGSSIAVDSFGNPYIFYYSNLTKDFKLTHWTGTIWATDTIESQGDVGKTNAISIDKNNNIHIAYIDTNHSEMRYLLIPASAAPTELKPANVAENTISWSWKDNSSNESGYRLLRSSDGSNLSGNLPPNTTSWDQVDLGPNSPQRVVVQAFSPTGVLNSVVSTTTYTRATPPTDLSLSLVSPSSMTVSWATTNPSGTIFRVDLSTDNLNFSELVKGPISSTVARALSSGTTYYFRACAFNGNDIQTAYSPLISAYIPMNPNAPSAPKKLSVIYRSTSSLTWGWDDTSDNETGFRVLRATDSENISGDLPPGTTFWVQLGLSPNQDSSIKIEAFNLWGSSQIAAVSGVTLPNAPRFTTAILFSGGILVSWDSNQNVLGTRFIVETSSDNDFFIPSTSTVFDNNALIKGLNFGTTYYFKVRAQSSDLISYSPFGDTASFFFPPLPSSPTISTDAIFRSTTTIAWSWTDASNETGYRIIRPNDGLNISGDLPANTTFWIQPNLLPSTTYQIQLEAFNEVGTTLAQWLSSSSFVSTLANPPKETRVMGMSPTAIHLSWLANSNPIWTMYKVEGSKDGVSYTVFADQLKETSTTINGLRPQTTYYFRIYALSQDAVLSDFDTPLMVFTPNGIDAKGGVVFAETSHAQITLNIPLGAFSSPTAIDVQTPLSFPSPNSPVYHLLPTGVGANIHVSPETQPSLPISISFSYRDEDIHDFDESKFVLARLNPDRDIWVPLPGSVNASSNKITAMTDHLSLFQLMMLVPGNSVGECKAFPNPFRPGQPGNEVLNFSSLPMGAIITIYTLRGEVVWERTADIYGNVSWDAKNDSGEPVASGVYLVFLDGDGGKKTIKVAVQR